MSVHQNSCCRDMNGHWFVGVDVATVRAATQDLTKVRRPTTVVQLPPMKSRQSLRRHSDPKVGRTSIVFTFRQYPSSVIARNTTLALALLSIDATWEKEKGLQPNGLNLATTLPPVGTLAFAHGHPASRLRSPVMTFWIVCGMMACGGSTAASRIQDQSNKTRWNRLE